MDVYWLPHMAQPQGAMVEAQALLHIFFARNRVPLVFKMLSLALFIHFAAAAKFIDQIRLVDSFSFCNSEGRASRSLETFITFEAPIALKRILNNIGSGDSLASGVAPGLVVASPSKANPDYFFTWARDSSLTFKALVDEFIAGNSGLQPVLQNYIYAQAQLQSIPNPSGDLSNGAGLGEPKFEVDGTAFTGAWGRPQRDGPALRATALIAYSRKAIANGGASTVTSAIWPIISNDLNYIAQYWNQTTFDLWEETEGSSFFTSAVQYRALVEGNTLAKKIGQTCPDCVSQAPQILCFLQSYWNGQYVLANVNKNNGRSSKDVNTILGSIHTFDPSAGCDDSTFQPCSERALANHKITTDSFRTVLAINSGIAQGSAVAVGRYPEDIYQGGNPWYLTTLAAAEQLYDALYQWKKIGSLNVTTTNRLFFADFMPSIAIGTYVCSTPTYITLTTAIKTYADGYIGVIEQYTPSDGSLAEQFSRNNGTPLSALDLTWSYTSFLTAVARRSGQMPASWGQPANTLPSTCSGTSAQGTYTTPRATAPPPPCTMVPAVAITFNVAETTAFGETVMLVGSISQLGSWDTAKAVALSAVDYKGEYPRWFATVPLPAGITFEYKFVKEGSSGDITYEDGQNRKYTVPMGCAAGVGVHDVWQ